MFSGHEKKYIETIKSRNFIEQHIYTSFVALVDALLIDTGNLI